MLFLRRPLIFAVLVGLCFSFSSGVAGDIRAPVWAGKFYPADPQKLNTLVGQLCRDAVSGAPALADHGSLRALILPHAGYSFSGSTAAHAARVIEKGVFDTIILIGPDHNVGFEGGAISNVSVYRTPLGDIPLHPDAAQLLTYENLFQSNRASDQTEHSLEVVLPFLQHLVGQFSLIPLVLGPGKTRAIGEVIRPLIDSRTLLVVSSDLSHYLSYAEAKKKDAKTIEAILKLDAAGMDRKNSACGKYGIQLLIGLARQLHWRPVLLHYANSGDAAGGRERVVGYSAIAFFQEKGDVASLKTRALSAEEGKVLVQLARQTIASSLGQIPDAAQASDLEKNLREKVFNRKGATFVTLTRNGQLRGCIGSLAPLRSLSEDVRTNALHASRRDPRFYPLKKKELGDITIEVSILTPPVVLHYTDSTDLIRKLRPYIDGVILRAGSHSATYLPQVWEQLPKPENFLSRLCVKANLSADAWKQKKLEVMVYQVQHFSEK